MTDKTITCIECGKTFTLSEKQQEWYQSKGWSFPKRCPTCREAKRTVHGKNAAKVNRNHSDFYFFASLMQSGSFTRRSSRYPKDGFKGYVNYKRNLVL